MQGEYKRRPTPTAAERLFKKTERHADGVNAYSEYEMNQRAKIKNMHHLRALRLSVTKVARKKCLPSAGA
jgi:hypothetical protein